MILIAGYIKILIIALIFLLPFVNVACSPSGNNQDVAEKYTFITQNDEMEWWIDTDRIIVSDQVADGKILEVWVKIDQKEYEMIEIAHWYISVDKERYKSTTKTIYDYDYNVLEY